MAVGPVVVSCGSAPWDPQSGTGSKDKSGICDNNGAKLERRLKLEIGSTALSEMCTTMEHGAE